MFGKSSMEKSALKLIRDDYCRLCSSRGRLFSIFEQNHQTFFQEIIFAHLNIKIQTSDSLSKMICQDCEEKLRLFHDYYGMVSRVQDWLTKCTIKDSIDESNSPAQAVVVEHHFYDDAEDEDVKEENVKEEQKKDFHTIEKQITAHCVRTSENLSDSNCDTDNVVNQALSNSDAESSDTPLSKLSKKCVNIRKETKLLQKRATPKEYHRQGYDCIDFTCPTCDQIFKRLCEAKRHCMRKHNTKPIIQCTKCNISMGSISTMYVHISNHNNPDSYKCNVCPKIFKSLQSLERHKERHVPKNERMFKCEICPITKATKALIKSHQQCHVPVEKRKIYDCNMCSMKFTSQQSVRGHKRAVHFKIKSYMCDVCGYKFATQTQLKSHSERHHDYQSYNCQVCFKRFKTLGYLKCHMDTHEGTSYQCEICKKMLNSRRTYRKHLLVHQTQRKFSCALCNLTFKRRSNLVIHMNSHTGDKTIACKWCEEKFMYYTTYRLHKHRYHADKLLGDIQNRKVT